MLVKLNVYPEDEGIALQVVQVHRSSPDTCMAAAIVPIVTYDLRTCRGGGDDNISRRRADFSHVTAACTYMLHAHAVKNVVNVQSLSHVSIMRACA